MKINSPFISMGDYWSATDHQKNYCSYPDNDPSIVSKNIIEFDIK